MKLPHLAGLATVLIVGGVVWLLALPSQRSAYLYELGCRALFFGRLPEAQSQFEAAAAICPDDSHTWECLSLSLVAQKRYDEAWGALQRALDLDPHRVELLVQGGALALQLQHHAVARQLLFQALRTNPRSQEALTLLARTAEAEGQPEQARRWYWHALQVNPHNAEGHRGLAGLESRQQHWQVAEREYLQAFGTSREGDADAAVQAAYAMLHQGQIAAAVDLLTKTAEQHPEQAGPHVVLGLILAQDPGRRAAARQELTVGLSLNPDPASAAQAQQALQQLDGRP